MTPLAAGGGGDLELILFGILAATGGLVLLAQRTGVPYPITLTLGGIALAFVPGVPAVELDPDLVLVLILPPLLYAAAFFSSLRDLRANLRPISLLAVGLVIATTLTVALVAHTLIDGLSWAAACVLGAVLAPTDPVAATAIAGRLGAPRRITTVVEGESLINDSTALIAYKFAVAAVVTGGFSVLDAGFEFVYSVAGGIAIGVVVGAVVGALRRRTEDPPTEITLSIVSPYLAYLPADALGLSGVIAAVTTGIYLGWRAPQLASPTTRLQAYAVWEILVFSLNAALFVLIGLQLRTATEGLDGGTDAMTLAGYAAAIIATVVLTRFAWLFPFTYLPRRLSRRLRGRDPAPPPSWVLVLGWSGLRGAVSLAAALAIPETTAGGAPFPERDVIVFLTFAVVVFTVVGQGLTLPLVVRAFDVHDDGGKEAVEESKARLRAAEAALRRLDELRTEGWVRDDTEQRVRGLYEFRRRRIRARFDADDDRDGIEARSLDYQRLARELLEAQRAEIVALRGQGRINDEVMRRIERELDLEDNRLEV